MKRIVFTRHAETSDNELGRLHGHGEVNFSVQGRANLRRLKIALDRYNFDIALVSDLGRCVETARYILYNRPEIITYTSLIREKSNGEFAGLQINEIDWSKLSGGFERRKPPGGESLIELRRRAKLFIGQLGSMDSESILVVSHGAFLKVLFGQLVGKNLRQSIFELHVDHCSLTHAEIDSVGKFRLHDINSISHL